MFSDDMYTHTHRTNRKCDYYFTRTVESNIVFDAHIYESYMYSRRICSKIFFCDIYFRGSKIFFVTVVLIFVD